MLITSITFVVFAMLIGLYMVFHSQQGKKHYPRWLPLTHFAAIGIGAILVIWAAFLTGNIQLWSNIAVAIIVSILGLMLSFGKWQRPTRKRILTAHITIAVVCTSFLIYSTVFLY